MASGSTSNYDLPYPKSTDKVRVAGDIEQLATKIDDILLESIEDASAAMWTGGTFSNGLNTPTYNDSTGKMSMSLSQDLRTSASPTFSALTVTNNASVNGGIISTSATSASLFNSNATSLNIGNAATTVSIGAPTGTFTINNASVVVSGDIAINGGDITTSQTTFNMINTSATTLNVGGAATVVNIGNSSGQTNFAGDINVATGKIYKINNVSVLSATTLGSSVVNSSLTSVGTISSGTWQGSTISASYGGTGQSSYTIGDILYASSTTALSKLAGVATGNALISGGVGSAPSWGKIGLTTHVSGTLPVANGGTGITSFGTGIATWLGTPSSANLAAAMTDETGTGSLVFANSPTFTGTVALPTTTHSGVATFNDYLNRVTGNGNAAWLQQDGTGRSHWYWNTIGGTSPTFTNAGEDASAITQHITLNGNGGSVFFRSANGVGAPAGGPITWTTTLYVDLNNITFKGTPLALTSGAIFTGTIITPAATTSIPSIRLPHGAAPTVPTNGDIWTTNAGLYVQINGITVGPLGTGGSGTAGGSFEMSFLLGGM